MPKWSLVADQKKKKEGVGTPRLEHFNLDGDNNYHSPVFFRHLPLGYDIDVCVYIHKREK